MSDSCNPPGSSFHGISQARILESVAISFARESSQPRGQTHISCIAGRFFTAESPVEKLFFFFFLKGSEQTSLKLQTE